jgi:hypothetical protein
LHFALVWDLVTLSAAKSLVTRRAPSLAALSL